jgi:prephenate dehydratase
MKIGYQGIPGSYSEEALILNMPEHEHEPCPTFTDLITACQNGTVDAVLLPIENTIGGSIKRAYHLMVEAELFINGEINHPVHHCLLANKGSTVSRLRYVMSHPEALLQCKHYIENRGWKIKEFRDTAESAKVTAQKKSITTAAIASHRCAKLYGLEILDDNIEDVKSNTTRFFLLERQQTAVVAQKITLTFGLLHKPGSLYTALKLIGDAGFNLTKIESCPIPNEPYHYEFVADIDVTNKDWNQLITELSKNVDSMKLLGAYPVLKPAEF